MRVLHHHLRVYHHIVVCRLALALVDGVPRTQVCPSEVALHHAHVLAALQHTPVDAQVGVRRIVLVDKCHLLFDGVLLQMDVYVFQHVREQPAEAMVQIAGVREDESCVPQKLAAVHEHLRKLALWLLRERLHLVEVLLLQGLALLDVAIAWLRSGGLHAHGQQQVVVRHEVKGFLDVPVEGLFVQHKLVRWHYHHLAVRIATADAHVCPGHTRGGASIHGLHHQVLFMQTRQLLSHQRGILVVGADEDVFLGEYLGKTVEGLL